MRKLTTIILIAVTCSLGLQSCYSPKPVIKLEPIQENTKWLQGKAFARDSLYGVAVSTAFNRYLRPHAIFEVEVINNSTLPLTVDPARMFFKALDANQNELPEALTSYALDPEVQILNLDKQVARLEASSKNAAIVGFVAAGVGVVAAVSSVTTDDPDKSDRRAIGAATALIASDVATAVSEEDEYSAGLAEDERYIWENTTLRKTTLEPRQAIKGRVYFLGNEDAKYIQLHFPIDDKFITFTYKQRKFLP
jgi:hypothetical protein